jgi:hypothetical protein
MIGATEKQQPNRNQSGLERDMTPEDPGTSRFPGLLEDEIFVITRSCDTAIYL